MGLHPDPQGIRIWWQRGLGRTLPEQGNRGCFPRHSPALLGVSVCGCACALGKGGGVLLPPPLLLPLHPPSHAWPTLSLLSPALPHPPLALHLQGSCLMLSPDPPPARCVRPLLRGQRLRSQPLPLRPDPPTLRLSQGRAQALSNTHTHDRSLRTGAEGQCAGRCDDHAFRQPCRLVMGQAVWLMEHASWHL